MDIVNYRYKVSCDVINLLGNAYVGEIKDKWVNLRFQYLNVKYKDQHYTFGFLFNEDDDEPIEIKGLSTQLKCHSHDKGAFFENWNSVIKNLPHDIKGVVKIYRNNTIVGFSDIDSRVIELIKREFLGCKIYLLWNYYKTNNYYWNNNLSINCDKLITKSDTDEECIDFIRKTFFPLERTANIRYLETIITGISNYCIIVTTEDDEHSDTIHFEVMLKSIILYARCVTSQFKNIIIEMIQLLPIYRKNYQLKELEENNSVYCYTDDKIKFKVTDDLFVDITARIQKITTILNNVTIKPHVNISYNL